MANEKTRFKAGISGNPNGRPPVAKEIRDLKSLTASELKEIISIVFWSTETELQDTIDDTTAMNIHKAICSLMMKVIREGSPTHFTILMDRLIGKVKEEMDVTISKPSILVRRNGEEIIFTNKKITKDPLNG